MHYLTIYVCVVLLLFFRALLYVTRYAMVRVVGAVGVVGVVEVGEGVLLVGGGGSSRWCNEFDGGGLGAVVCWGCLLWLPVGSSGGGTCAG